MALDHRDPDALMGEEEGGAQPGEGAPDDDYLSPLLIHVRQNQPLG
ncbi:hypothetical protein GCM10010341_48450 [Streptomyces noursei]|nr:hypothetical protein GCM10010341_48450 [Streptomyces noursei]